MNSTPYFLADLPPGTTFSTEMIADACRSLKQNRASFLDPLPTSSLIEMLGNLAAEWLNPPFPFRQQALNDGPASTGFSRPVLERGLDLFFKQITADNLRQLVLQDLGHLERLDHFVATEPELQSRRRAIATSPTLIVHVTAGNLPIPAFHSMVLALLARSAQFIKCATGTSWLPRVFAHSIHALYPKIAACIEIAEWPGGALHLESALFEHADCVTATGQDETLLAIRSRIPHDTRFLGYGHRVSFGYLTKELLSQSEARLLASRAALDITAWDQAGCLSPHLYYVETGGSIAPGEFAELLAKALAEQEIAAPRAPIPTPDAAEITLRRSAYQLRAAQSPETQLWQSSNSTAWTVVFETDPRFQLSCLNRFVYVKPAHDLTEVLHHIAPFRNHISSVALAAAGDKLQSSATTLARHGAHRICAPGQLQNPALTWRHDGRPSLAELISWTDWEL